MARLAGVDLPRNKRIEIGLTYIYGLGRHAANVVLKGAGFVEVAPEVLSLAVIRGVLVLLTSLRFRKKLG